VRASLGDIPVIGPGGRVLTFAVRSQVLLDVVMRPRREALRVRWRDSGEVEERIGPYVGVPGIAVRPGFGYFEASKYERQDIMRLVYAFLIDRHTQDGDGAPSWRRVVIEPATIQADGEIWTGLEQWRRQP
jgi:hypothetical protein